MKKITCSVVLLLTLPLAGCSYFNSAGIQSRDQAYLEARSIPPLRTPPGVSTNSFENEYPVSDRTYSNKSLKISPVPPGL